MERYIKYGNQTQPMPDGMKLDEAKAIMARHFPELAENPKVETKKDGDKTTYVFSKQAGRKGLSPLHAVVRNLDALKAQPTVESAIVDYALGQARMVEHAAETALANEIARVPHTCAALLRVAPAFPAEGEGGDLL